jgi:hypothetical protein
MALLLRITAATLSVVAWCAIVPIPAGATGTLLIQRKDGQTNTYDDIEIKIFAGSLFLTSDDGDGTIVVTRAACSYQGKIIVCLPTTAALVQDGESQALNLRSGTIYLNTTDAPQQLTLSSAKIPANSVLVALTTKSGTFVTVRGQIDELIKQ